MRQVIYYIIFLVLTIYFNNLYFLVIFWLSLYLKTDNFTISYYRKLAITQQNIFLYYYGFIALFAEIIILPIHLMFGMLLKKRVGKGAYTLLTKLIAIVTFRRVFILLGEISKG